MKLVASFNTAPVSVRAIALIEALQRIAYVGGRAIILLMLSREAMNGGFNWSQSDALRFFGTFIALYLATPIAGGLLADRWLGHRRAVGLGLGMLLVGNMLLALSAYLVFSGDVSILQSAADRSIGIGSFEALAIPVLQVPSFAFLTGCCLIVIGNGFYQSCAMALVGAAYSDTDPRRESGFTLHYIGQSAGFLGGALIVGTLGEVVSWTTGFIAGVMALGLASALFLWAYRYFVPSADSVIVTEDVDTSGGRVSSRLVVLTALAAVALIYTIGYEQFMGFVQLFVIDRVDRNVLGFTIPATWYPQLVSIFALVIGGAYVVLQDNMTSQGKQISVPTKFAIGMVLLVGALGILYFAVAAADMSADGMTGSTLIVISYLVLTMSEIVLWPLGFATAERLAPAGQKAAWLGLWLLVCASLGSFVAGFIGGHLIEAGAAKGLLILMVCCLGAAALLVMSRKWLVKLADDGIFSGEEASQ